MDAVKINAVRLTELRKIAKKHNGILHAEDVIAEARQLQSPLHACFEWNDGVAAEKYRLEQARNMIRITVIYQPKCEREITAFVSLKSDRYEGDGGYKFVPDVVKTRAGRAALIDTALWELKMFQQKYADVKQFAGLFDEIKKLIAA